jgi:ABC-type uncharacterized transport system permease subunit
MNLDDTLIVVAAFIGGGLIGYVYGIIRISRNVGTVIGETLRLLQKNGKLK